MASSTNKQPNNYDDYDDYDEQRPFALQRIATPKSLPYSVHVRPMGPQDTEQVARIWRNGLEQTIDALCTGIFAVFRPLAEFLTNWAAQVALSKNGDIGPNGENLLQRWSGRDDRCMFVAVVVVSNHASDNDEIVVGCVGVKQGISEHHTDPTSSWASVWRMSVDASYRRCGVGTRLMDAAEDWARSKQCESMILITINPLAATFYRQQGYQPARFRFFHFIQKL